MSSAARIFTGYVLVFALTAWGVVYTALDVIKPGMRQSAEETLVDTANLLALLVADDVREGTLEGSDFAARLADYAALAFEADIWGVAKREPNHRVYVTDAQGRVIFDSSGRDLGADYSRWNDVWLTLRGRYGARSTTETPGEEGSSVMYVAAPVTHNGEIIGVLSVGKPNLSMQPFIARAERRVWVAAAMALGAALVLAFALAWWQARPVRALVRYARDVTAGRRAALPAIADRELALLADALETMRAELDGRVVRGPGGLWRRR